MTDQSERTTPTSAAVRLPEFLCDDCSEGDHRACLREGGWMYQDTNERCSCHLTGHALDPRRRRPPEVDLCAGQTREGQL